MAAKEYSNGELKAPGFKTALAYGQLIYFLFMQEY